MSELSDVKAEEQSADIVPDGATKEPEKEPEPAKPPKVRRLNIIGRRNVFFALSLIIIVPGIISMATHGFRLGIDFAGGTELTVNFANHPTLRHTFVYSNKTWNDAIFRNALAELASEHPNRLAVLHTLTREEDKRRFGPSVRKGRITADMLQQQATMRSDTEAARRMQKAKLSLLARCRKLR